MENVQVALLKVFSEENNEWALNNTIRRKEGFSSKHFNFFKYLMLV